MFPAVASGASGKKFHYYQCGSPRTKTLGGARCGAKMTPAGWVEDLVSESLAEWCRTPDKLRDQFEKSRKDTTDPQLNADLESIKAEIVKQERLLRAAGAAWSKATGDGDDDQATIFSEHMVLASGKLKSYREKEASIRGRMHSADKVKAALDSFEVLLAAGSEALQSGDLTFDEKRSLLEGLQARVTANGKQARMMFVHPTSSS